ncbi:MAG: FecR domain-containing protein, partial [Gammaproteobacteria bacterium]|nr:FecR domain-containing protein [Gammaproteobacteria bacterium]
MSITDTTRLTRPLPALLCLLLIAGPALAREPAGKIIFSAGTVAIEATDQTTRSATKGMAVFAGETLVANDGIIQVEFADGGFFSVQPQSRLKIEDYRFNGTEDGSESAIFKLLKGGLRAISGAIGHRHPKRYQLHTVVATIGIRGTAYSALLCQQ